MSCRRTLRNHPSSSHTHKESRSTAHSNAKSPCWTSLKDVSGEFPITRSWLLQIVIAIERINHPWACNWLLPQPSRKQGWTDLLIIAAPQTYIYIYIYILNYINMQIIVRPSWSKYLLHVADILVISPSAQAKKKSQHQQGRRRSRLPCRRVNFWRPPRHWDVIPRI